MIMKRNLCLTFFYAIYYGEWKPLHYCIIQNKQCTEVVSLHIQQLSSSLSQPAVPLREAWNGLPHFRATELLTRTNQQLNSAIIFIQLSFTQDRVGN